jgi:hypothetical protein
MQIPISPDDLAAAAARLQQRQGIVLTLPEGKIAQMGVTAAYRYADGVLTVDILEKPFFVSTAYCEEQLKSFLSQV